MPESTKQQSNPFSTGGGGSNFETRVQAAFTVLMLSGQPAPCLPAFPITKIKLQGRYAGFHTDDFIAFSKQIGTETEAKLLAQIKHNISITANDTVFAEVIQSTWKDFNDESFDSNIDALALITGPLSATDINDVRPILEWARHSENADEFFLKVNTANFSSDAKRKKLKAFQLQLKVANNETDIADQQLWKFLRAFHVIGYDLDIEAGTTLSLLHALITQRSNQAAVPLWGRVIDVVQIANQNAGTFTVESLPADIRIAFSTNSSNWSADILKFKEHGQYILDGIRTTIGEIHIRQLDAFDQLLSLTETSNFVFVSGGRGSGKSSLIREFSNYISGRAPVFCLRTEDLDQAHLDNVFSAMGLKGSLRDVEAGLALTPKKYLLIESLEKLLELERTTAFTDLLNLLKKQQGWTVIATGRDYAYQQITFYYLQSYGVKFTSLTLNGFSDAQIHHLCEQLKPLQKLSNSPTLKLLLKFPFFADLAYRVLETGTEFTPEDGERQFRTAVWQYVIAKEQERASGMPLKRKRAFINIAVKRAKQMVYGVPEAQYDSDAVLKLEEDNLIRRDAKNSLISPAHDVLEDWALDQYIEEAYQRYSSHIQNFLNEIGHEPAMNRAFRLWLHQRLRYGEDADDFVHSVLSSQSVQRHWQDETISAVLQGENPSEFLELLKDQLFLHEGELLKRFCFVLRIACQLPDQALNSTSAGNDEAALVDVSFLKPYGLGWKALICFLFENRELVSKGLVSHTIAVLNNWASALHLDEELPVPAREAGLLSLYLLADIKESYRDDSDRKKLLSVIIKTISAIHEEFLELLASDIFVSENERCRPRYVEDLCAMAFQGVESAFFCRYDPDTLIKLACFEWLLKKSRKNNEFHSRSSIAINHFFRLHEHRYEFSPASGAKGPFQHLLRFHPLKGLTFILKLLNSAAEEYAYSNLDAPYHGFSTRHHSSEPVLKPLLIQLNDGSNIEQYYSGRLWVAYRGHSVVPDLLQSALMALENWLIDCAEHLESKQLKKLFDYIFRNSNSVMPTAVLASVATGFPEKVGEAALPLLKTPELYHMDRGRIIHERGGNEFDWHRSSFQRDALSEVYSEERRIAALRPWRTEHLELLVIRLQFSAWREEALTAIDSLRTLDSEDERMRFLLHRVDSRGWRPVEDQENNRIIFEPQGLEPDLKNIQEQTQEVLQVQGRFSRFYVWARKTFEHQLVETECYATWWEALAEAKELLDELKAGAVEDLATMYFGAIVTAAAVFIRDHSNELTREDGVWCAELVSQIITENADADNSLAVVDATDQDGAAAAASVLPILLDSASEEYGKFIVRSLIITALTHANENVRHKAADGIRSHLWQRDPKFAQNCIVGSLEYARFQIEQNNWFIRRQISSLEGNSREIEVAKLKAKRNEFRDQFVQGELTTNFEQITLRSHSSEYILESCLMIPDGSLVSSHIKILLQILTLFFEAEQQEDSRRQARDEGLEINCKIRLSFTKRFSKYLFELQGSKFKEYTEKLQIGCEVAPDFMGYLILCVAVEADRKGEKEAYWQFWKELSQSIQKIATEIAESEVDHRQQNNRRKLIRTMLKADIEWQEVDYATQDIALGKDLLLEFATNAGKNPDVFEALAALMYYFPSIFFESGVHILSNHQKEEGGMRLLSRVNTAFYLVRAIQRFIQLDQTGPLPRRMHESCLVLLNMIVETASSKAYYLREHLIRSRKILQS